MSEEATGSAIPVGRFVCEVWFSIYCLIMMSVNEVRRAAPPRTPNTVFQADAALSPTRSSLTL